MIDPLLNYFVRINGEHLTYYGGKSGLQHAVVALNQGRKVIDGLAGVLLLRQLKRRRKAPVPRQIPRLSATVAVGGQTVRGRFGVYPGR